MKAFVKILMLAAILTISVDAVAISKSKFMVKAMDKMVGEPETALFDNLGRPDKTKVVEGTSIYKWHGGGCTISVETKDEKVVRWFIIRNLEVLLGLLSSYVPQRLVAPTEDEYEARREQVFE